MPAPEPWRRFAAAPLAPLALAVGAGLCLDRYLEPDPVAAVALAAVALAAAARALRGRLPIGRPLLWAGYAGLAAGYHAVSVRSLPADDVARLAGPEPALVRLRGVLRDEPDVRPGPVPLREPGSYAPPVVDRVVLDVTGRRAGPEWLPASGGVMLRVARAGAGPPALAALHAGDAVEVVGLFNPVSGPSNPGEVDTSKLWRDLGIRGDVVVGDGGTTLVRLEAGADPWRAGVARARGWGARVLTERLPPAEAGVARALLLGDTGAMERAEWDLYRRTGVVHVLAISGQHLVVLAGFLWLLARAAGVRSDRAAWGVLLLVAGYAVLTGLRPSGVRAAAGVAAASGGAILRRPVNPANALAAGWLAVALLQPADVFTLGCQLSFLSVLVLVFGVGPLLAPGPPDPLDALIDESRAPWERLGRRLTRVAAGAFALSFLLAATTGPLLLAGTNVAAPVSVMLGPPLVLLTSVALVAGFLLILLSPLGPVAAPLAWATEWSLAAAGRVVRLGAELPGGSVPAPAPPGWWVAGFTLGVAAAVLLGPGHFRRSGRLLLAWLAVGLVLPELPRAATDELRVTFLAVGHGGCVVLEAPDGRCLLYDCGTTLGPGAVRRVVAPYLWHRGIRRVDELFLSHADADHINGTGELLSLFPVGRCTVTPSFPLKGTAEVREVLAALARRRVPFGRASAGDRFDAGAVSLEVLHPPTADFGTTENERSLVMAVRHAGHTVLLTGDLEKRGAGRVLALPPVPADVMMAPHHGSRGASPGELARWCRPRLAVMCRGREPGRPAGEAEFGAGVAVWNTQTHGAVTLRSGPAGLTAEAFRTGEVLALRGAASSSPLP